METNTTRRISGRESAQQIARLASETNQRVIADKARARNARRAAAGVLPDAIQITPEIITERLAVLTESTQFPSLLAEDHGSLLMDVADESGANGQRTFVVKVREVDPLEGHTEDAILALGNLLAQAAEASGGNLAAVARYLMDAGVTL